MVDLFSIVLSAGVSWGVERLLDSFVECGRGESQKLNVVNYNYNTFHCPHCTYSLSQYVNASQHTVNRNRSIVSAALSNIHWPTWKETFKCYFDLDVVNCKGEDVVIEMVVGQFRGSEFHKYNFPLKSTYERTSWKEHYVTFSESYFPTYACTVAVDLLAYNVWGDLLDKQRTLMEFSGKKFTKS